MAIRLTRANSQYLSRNSGFLNFNANYTFMVWAYFVTIGNFQGLLYMDAGGFLSDESFEINGSNQLSIDTNNTRLAGTTTIVAGTWYHLAVVSNGNTLSTFRNGVADIANSVSIAGRNPPTTQQVGSFHTGNFLDGRLDDLIIYTRALSVSEILEQMSQRQPIDWTALYAYYPTYPTGDNIRDYSGNRNDWTVNAGPITDELPSPVPSGNFVLLWEMPSALPTINGTLNSTLGAVTSSAAAAVAVNATDASTLGAVTSTATAATAINATASSTLDAVSVSSSAQVAVHGTLSSTLDAVTGSDSGQDTIHGTLNVTLDAVTVSASGNVQTPINATLNVTLGAITSAAAGTVAVNCTLSETLGAVFIKPEIKIGGTITITSTGPSVTLSIQPVAQS